MLRPRLSALSFVGVGRLAFGLTAMLALVHLATPLAAVGAEPSSNDGARIYTQMCARCHGASGEGTKDNYPHPLAGDRSVPQLARLIAKTMPDDDPGACVGEDAQKVAAYIHQAFYIKAMKAIDQSLRIELSRLTVRQYRNAVADLLGSFRNPPAWDDKHGLRGQYSKSRQGRRGGGEIDRVDPVVQFDFGTVGPDPKKFEPHQFSIRWEGSVLAPETGEYEFNVRTEHATRLFVNDNERPLVDAWVQSGTDLDHRGSIYLIGGRHYPLRLEFSKSIQGVNDPKNKERMTGVKASIALEWKLPHRTSEIVPERALTPNRVPVVYVVATEFPPDDRTVGYERGTSVSKAWDQAETNAAIEVATYVASHLRELTGVADDAADRPKKLREFATRFAERAFRRPLSDEQKERYIERRFKDSADLDLAIKRVVLLVLKSPLFLYRDIAGNRDGYDVASRLSFGLWDSLPDAALIREAAGSKLTARDQVTRQAERMVGDSRTRAKVREFFFQWLKVEQVPDLAKDPVKFPGFDAAIASDLRTSLDLFLDEVVWGDASDFRQLLLADFLFVNGRLGTYYGAELPPDAPFQKVELDASERAGVLSHPYLLSTFAYTATSSPIHRGVYVARSLLGRSLRPPPQAVAPLPPDLHAGLTTRERVALQTSPASCRTCHAMINPLGFGMERFDAVGRFRREEKGKSIDASGLYETRSGEVVKFAGVRELAAFLAGSEETQSAFVEQLFQYLVKHPIRAFGPQTLPDLRRKFVENEFNIRKLIVDMMVLSALKDRENVR